MSDVSIDQDAQQAATVEAQAPEVVTEEAPAAPLTPADHASALRDMFSAAETLGASLEAQKQAALADVVANLRAKTAEAEAAGLIVEHGLDTDGADRFAVKVFQMVKTEV